MMLEKNQVHIHLTDGEIHIQPDIEMNPKQKSRFHSQTEQISLLHLVGEPFLVSRVRVTLGIFIPFNTIFIHTTIALQLYKKFNKCTRLIV